MNTDKNEHDLSNALDIDDPELIKFMNTKMVNRSFTFLDICLDLINFAFDKVIVLPYNNIYDYIMNNVDFNIFFSQELINHFRPKVFLETSEVEVESYHVLVENNNGGFQSIA